MSQNKIYICTCQSSTTVYYNLNDGFLSPRKKWWEAPVKLLPPEEKGKINPSTRERRIYEITNTEFLSALLLLSCGLLNEFFFILAYKSKSLKTCNRLQSLIDLRIKHANRATKCSHAGQENSKRCILAYLFRHYLEFSCGWLTLLVTVFFSL